MSGKSHSSNMADYKPRKTIHDESGMILPPEIVAMGVNFPRDFEKLHRLNLPVSEMPIARLEYHLDLPFFWQPDQPFSLKPREVLNNPQTYVYRYGRIMGVDTSFPIDVIWWKRKWVILDGLHRLCQLVIRGETMVKVRKLPHKQIKDIVPNGYDY